MTAWFIFFLLALPFFLNDFVFAVAVESDTWLFTDYATKLFALFLALWLIQTKRLAWRQLGLSALPFKEFVFWSVLLSVTGILIDQFAPLFLKSLPDWRFFSFPAIADRWVTGVDLTFGLMLTALSEEVVFRGAALLFLAAYFKKTWAAVIFSVLVFGAIHWGLGMAVMISAALWGILPALSVLKTRSIWPAVVAHYLTNLVDFSGVL